MTTQHHLDQSPDRNDLNALKHQSSGAEHITQKLLLDSHKSQSDLTHKGSDYSPAKNPQSQFLDLDTKHLYQNKNPLTQHVVSRGETLSGISQKHLNKSASTKDIYNYVDKLAATNHIKNPDLILTGQVLIYPRDAHERKQSGIPNTKPPYGPEITAAPKPVAKQIPAAASAPVAGQEPVPQRLAVQPKAEPDLLHKFTAVAGAVTSGIVDEVIHHPDEVVKNAAIGAAAAFATAFVAPEVAIAVGTVGTVAGLYELSKHAGDWIKAGGVLADPHHHNEPERKAAEETLHGLGRGITDFGAGLAGGGLGHIGLKAIDRATTAEAEAIVKANAVEKNTSVVRIESPEEHVRFFHVGDKQYNLKEGGGWFYGKFPANGNVSPVKLHVSVSGPEDLANLQKVLIPYLKDDPVADKLAFAWKTFDPNHSIGTASPGAFQPGLTGQNAKGFTIYTETAKDAIELQGRIDKELTAKGLGLEKPQETGNVDIVTGTSNRVGILRDHYPATEDSGHNVGIKVDHGLVERIKAKFGNDSNLDTEQLRAVEREAGIAPNSLRYDRDNELMLKLQRYSKPKKGGDIYVDESKANKIPGQKNDRPAIYALAHLFGWNPAEGIN